MDVCPDEETPDRQITDDAIHVSVNKVLNGFKNSNLTESNNVGRAVIKFLQGDFLTAKTVSLLNASNGQLVLGSGTSAAIRSAAPGM